MQVSTMSTPSKSLLTAESAIRTEESWLGCARAMRTPVVCKGEFAQKVWATAFHYNEDDGPLWSDSHMFVFALASGERWSKDSYGWPHGLHVVLNPPRPTGNYGYLLARLRIAQLHLSWLAHNECGAPDRGQIPWLFYSEMRLEPQSGNAPARFASDAWDTFFLPGESEAWVSYSDAPFRSAVLSGAGDIDVADALA